MEKEFAFRLDKFSGCHFSDHSSFQLSDGESPEMLNFKVTGGHRLEKRKGFERILTCQGDLRGAWYGKVEGQECFLAVQGNRLYHSAQGFLDLTEVEGEAVPGTDRVFFFPFFKSVYLLTGETVIKFSSGRASRPVPYVPLVMTATTPGGSGTLLEEPNLLSNRVRQRYSPDGETRIFVPALPKVTLDVLEVKENGEVVSPERYIWNDLHGTLNFLYQPIRGIDTIEVTYQILWEEEVARRIYGCRYAVAFGGASDTRAFLYGNPATPAMRYHSGMVEGEPSLEYFPESGYTFVGSGAPITAIMRHYDRQLIFTENAAYYSYLEYLTGENEKLIASFPVFPLSDDRGSLPMGQSVLIENAPCSLTKEGLFSWVSTNIRDERNAVCISGPIAKRLQGEEVKEAVLFHRKTTSEMMVCIRGHLYVYNYRLKLFYYYEVPSLAGFLEVGTELYFYHSGGIFAVRGNTDDGEAIRAVWRSKAFSFENPLKQKSLYRLSLYAKAPEGAAVRLLVRTDTESAEDETEMAFPACPTQTSVGIRMDKKHFSLLEICIETDQTNPFLLLGAEWKGRITEKMS